MRRRHLLALVALSVVVTACGGGGSSTGASSSSAQPRPTSVSSADLDAKRLVVADVGAGWQPGPEVTEADFSDASKIPCGDVTLDPAVARRVTPVTGVQFEPTDRSYKHLIELFVTGAPDQLDSDLEAYFAAIESCAATPSTAPGSLTARRLVIPDLGEQRTAYVLSGTEAADSGATWYVRTAAVRVGPVAVEIGLTEILPTPQATPEISDAEYVALLQKAVAKLTG